MIFGILYVTILQKLNKSIVKIDKNKYEITYVINGKLYKMLVSPTRGPALVLQVSNELQNDITDEIIPFLGPNYNFHGQDFSPNYLNHQLLTFELFNGEEKTFEKKEIIKLNL